jgi:hypothetical protein
MVTRNYLTERSEDWAKKMRRSPKEWRPSRLDFRQPDFTPADHFRFERAALTQ